MNTCLPYLALPALLALCCSAVAQQAPVKPAPAASAVQSKTQPRAMTAGEKADSANVPGDRRPEEPVVPQIQIPLGKRPALPETREQTQRRGKAEARGGIDDDIARCKAEASEVARNECLTRLRKVGKTQ
jgi:hypothetical protein